MNIEERCSCGAREKNKCSKESEHNTGKMCLKGGMEDIGIRNGVVNGEKR
jgi:hypothetical protein